MRGFNVLHCLLSTGEFTDKSRGVVSGLFFDTGCRRRTDGAAESYCIGLCDGHGLREYHPGGQASAQRPQIISPQIQRKERI